MAPELSVIIPTHDRRELLRRCLESLARQIAAPDEFEVVVVVDGSTDGTVELLEGLTHAFKLSIVTQQQSGVAAARNAGAARAAGRILLFMDDDEEASAAHVRAHLDAHQGRERIACFGAIRNVPPPRSDRLVSLRAEAAREHWDELANRAPTFLDCAGGNCSVTRAMFDEIGGFAEDLPRENDFDFAYRLHRAGVEFVFVTDSLVTQSLTKDWNQTLADAERRGKIAVTLYRRHPPLIASMPLGGEAHRPRSFVILRSLALAINVPPRPLASVGFLLPRRSWAHAWFQFTWSYCYWRGVRSASDHDLWRRLRTGTAILTYHGFGEPGEAPSRYVVPARRFARQLTWLKRRGYNVISLSDYLRYRREHTLPPPKSVVLTVDDGYVDTDKVARPILERHRLRATVFLISSSDGRDPADTDPALRNRPLLSLGQAASIGGSSIEFGAHTRTHPDLTRLELAAAQAEVAGSKQDLEHALGTAVAAFSYPYGELNAAVRAVVASAGFECACGITPGHNRPATDSFDLRRITVFGTYTLPRFAATLVIGDTRKLLPRGRRR
jgi:peptidoglycan/xylan/chitin deacetylase (PgdA/CDA1 family)/GT2 family glycosyltransferase